MRRLAVHGRALVLVGAARVLLKRQDTTRALRRLARARRRPPAIPMDEALLAVQRAGRVTRAACLAQSIALVAMLERDGRDTVLVLGCRRYADRQWGAHAWVEAEGKVLEPVAAGAHEELAQLDAAHAWIPTPRG